MRKFSLFFSATILFSVISLFTACSDSASTNEVEQTGIMNPPSGDGLLLAGNWQLSFTQRDSSSKRIVLNSNGKFTNNGTSGFWTSNDGINITIQYSVGSEIPPTGTKFSGTASEDKSEMSGNYDYIPSFINSIQANDTWTAIKQ